MKHSTVRRSFVALLTLAVALSLVAPAEARSARFEVEVNVPGDLNENGQLAGIYIDATGREQAYVFRPGEGVVKVDVGRFRESAALWINSEGVVGGTGNRRKGRDSIFFAATGSKGPSRVIGRGKFKRLVRGAGSRKLVGMQVLTMNERLEFIGEVRAENPQQRVPFFYSRSSGLVSIRSILEAAGADLKLDYVVDLNDNGQILVQVRQPDGAETGAILTPLEKKARRARRSKARNELGQAVKPLPEPAGDATSGPRRSPGPIRERPRL